MRPQGQVEARHRPGTHRKELEFYSKFDGKPLREFKKPLIKKKISGTSFKVIAHGYDWTPLGHVQTLPTLVGRLVTETLFLAPPRGCGTAI